MSITCAMAEKDGEPESGHVRSALTVNGHLIVSIQIEGYGTVYDYWVINIRRCRSGGPTSEDQIPITSTILNGAIQQSLQMRVKGPAPDGEHDSPRFSVGIGGVAIRYDYREKI
ncbi:hypothetical protein I7I51_06322 [Histoplasma capsulatum]|uniref:Uncharacterized protein n=1 Tax=Ajellomyces capsulatus TaxID=5037 RepID=A0A8A1MFT1_AJECA|nr:hypothetical protein I7I51_06322 [Histoplasma capsulatum]